VGQDRRSQDEQGVVGDGLAPLVDLVHRLSRRARSRMPEASIGSTRRGSSPGHPDGGQSLEDHCRDQEQGQCHQVVVATPRNTAPATAGKWGAAVPLGAGMPGTPQGLADVVQR